MESWLAENQSVLRGGVFLCVLTLLLILERRLPRRLADPQRRLRWPANFGLVAVDTAALWLLPVATTGAAWWGQQQGLGLFNALAWPRWLEFVLAWLALDCAIYWQHRALHEIRWLWPLHRVHHSDVEFDASSGLRFHPAEILLSAAYKMGVALALGAPPAAVLLLEIALNGFSLFTHANLRLPPLVELALRRLLVTPDMHRIHHSVYRVEMDSNYGSSLSVWDRLFRSYTAEPRDGQLSMRIGLEELRSAAQQRLGALLLQPFYDSPPQKGLNT